MNNKQHRKLKRLGGPKEVVPKRCVFNFSNRRLTPEEFEVLNKGPDFVPTPSKYDEIDIMVETEYLLSKIKLDEDNVKDLAFHLKRKSYDLMENYKKNNIFRN